MKAVAATILAVVAVAVTLAACGSDGEDSAVTHTQATLEEDGGDGRPPAKPKEASAKADGKRTFAEEHPGSAVYGSPPLEFKADPGGDLAYTADEVTAREGNVTIEFTNPQSTPHNVAMEALPSKGRVETKTVENGFSAVTITLNTKEEFIFYCTVPGHREAGMEGIVRVKPRG